MADLLGSLDDGEQFKLAVPVIVGGSRDLPVGTAFLVLRHDGHSVFMTARHVVEAASDVAVVVAESQGASPDQSGGTVLLCEIPALKVLKSARYDVALIATEEPCDGLLLLPFGRTKSLTAEFFNLEYTQSLRDPDSGLVRVEPSYHVGRAARRAFIPDRLTGAIMSVMSMPWPAWRGSSGSPVIEMNPQGWTIAGMVVENQESERLPAHLEVIVAEDGQVAESVKYFVPNAVVITERHLYEVMTDEFGALFKGSR